MNISARGIGTMLMLAAMFAAAPVHAEEEPRTTALEMSEIEQALAYHRAVTEKVVAVAIDNYPPESLRAGETGQVILGLDVNPDGSLAEVTARELSSAPARLIDAGIAAAMAAAPFEPYDASLAVMFRHVELQVDYAIKK